jgi:glycosyltransferase involved in cell wall biosynthesis
MRVLHVSSSDISGGASRAAFRLFQGLKAAGLDVHMLVGDRKSQDQHVTEPASGPRKAIARALGRIDHIPLYLYPNRQGNLWLKWISGRAASVIAEMNPDIVHLHWFNSGFLRIESLTAFGVPIVWTLHEMWPFTGGCIYSGDCNRFQASCGRCPILRSDRERDLSRWVWRRKRRTYERLDLTFVSPSRWLSLCASESSLLKDRRIEVIPNSIDLNQYKPMGRQAARHHFRLPLDKDLILFGAENATEDKRKGFQFLHGALNKLAARPFGDNIELVVFGAAGATNSRDLGFKVNYIGRLEDDASLALLYSAPDVFVAPSIQDNLPNTVMESLACGTPCVAFRIGGMPDMIDHGANGYLARPFDIDDLAQGMLFVLREGLSDSMGDNARKGAERNFGLEVQAERSFSLYEEILSSKERSVVVSKANPFSKSPEHAN